jgi:hypothetical protein
VVGLGWEALHDIGLAHDEGLDDGAGGQEGERGGSPGEGAYSTFRSEGLERSERGKMEVGRKGKTNLSPSYVP